MPLKVLLIMFDRSSLCKTCRDGQTWQLVNLWTLHQTAGGCSQLMEDWWYQKKNFRDDFRPTFSTITAQQRIGGQADNGSFVILWLTRINCAAICVTKTPPDCVCWFYSSCHSERLPPHPFSSLPYPSSLSAFMPPSPPYPYLTPQCSSNRHWVSFYSES